MKNLILIRHGKATHEPMPDKKRFLTEKGIKRSRKFAEKLKEQNIKPDLMISSPATRAYETAKIFADIFDYPIEAIQINDNFYFAPDELVFNELYSLPNEKNTIFLFGHNPLWTELADYFSQNEIWQLRTSGIFGVSFDTNDWTKIETAPKKDLVLIN